MNRYMIQIAQWWQNVLLNLFRRVAYIYDPLSLACVFDAQEFDDKYPKVGADCKNYCDRPEFKGAIAQTWAS